MKDPSDNLTPLARRILKESAATAYEKLLITPTSGNPRALADLTAASPEALCAKPITNMDEARSVLAGLWLWQDYLDESHELCQIIETPSGSYWHAILHRREGDFGNAKYWFARAGAHPAIASFAVKASELLRDAPADKRLLRMTSPNTAGAALVDLVEQVADSPSSPLYRTAVALQQLEFRTLFEFNVSQAQQ